MSQYLSNLQLKLTAFSDFMSSNLLIINDVYNKKRINFINHKSFNFILYINYY